MANQSLVLAGERVFHTIHPLVHICSNIISAVPCGSLQAGVGEFVDGTQLRPVHIPSVRSDKSRYAPTMLVTAGHMTLIPSHWPAHLVTLRCWCLWLSARAWLVLLVLHAQPVELAGIRRCQLIFKRTGFHPDCCVGIASKQQSIAFGARQ